MEMPEFPPEFVKQHCLKVLEARHWRKVYVLPPDPEEDEAHAECAFISAGVGLQCENCGQYVHPVSETNPGPLDRPADACFGAIKKYYLDSEAYYQYTQSDQYKQLECKAKEEAEIRQNLGAFI